MSSLSQIGQYRIEAHLGTGEWTETYHAYDIVLRRPVALKLLRPGILPAGKSYQDFLAAAQLASELVHPRIAWVWSTGEQENRYFIVERFIGGESLASQLSKNGPLPWDKALRILEQVAQATEFAEERQWVHGRVTPHNILLSSDHGAILSDYGLENAIRKTLPLSAINLYDAQYLAPEVLQKKPVTSRADQYALACTLVEMLSGKNPFQAGSLEEILLLKTTEHVKPLLPVDIMPVQAAEIVERSLHAETSARFANALDFVSALDRSIRNWLSDTTARQQHEETLRSWRAEEETSRMEAEEAARLAALDQARQEIHERAHLEAEQAINLQGVRSLASESQDETQPIEETLKGMLPPASEKRDLAPDQSRSARVRRSPRQQLHFWPVFILFMIVLLGMGGYWMMDRQSASATPTASHTSTSSAQPAFQPGHITPTPSLTSTRPEASATSTTRPSPSPSRASTKSPTPSQTLAPSPTATIIPPSPTATRVRPDKEDRAQSG